MDIEQGLVAGKLPPPAPARASSRDTERGCDVVLRNGSTVYVRPVREADATALLAFHHQLSPTSRYFRFMACADLTLASAARFARADGRVDFGLVAEAAGGICAVAHALRNGHDPARAEVAFAVTDAFQGQGLGTKLLEQLAIAVRPHGVTVFDALMLADNRRMLDVLLQSGFEVDEFLGGGLVRVSLETASSASSASRIAARNIEAASASMKHFFEPASVAVIGASRHPDQIGGALFRNLHRTGFRGRLTPVNPSAREVDGVPARASVLDIAEPVDLAIVTVPAPQVERVIDECLAKGVRAMVIVSAGFSETGAEGRARERAILEKVRAAGVRVIGPNCMGLVNTDPAICLNGSFGPIYPPAGRVALATQSGALGLAMLEYAQRLGLGLSTFVSMGNKTDVSGNDLIQYWASDPRTDVILLYLESFGNPQNFNTIARRVSRQKPIVALKAGRSRLGARAASSHTGALASDDALVDALFHQTGVIRTGTLEEFFDVATLLAHQPLPAGRRVAILTNAGGPGILAADACDTQGLTLATLSETTVTALRALLPPAASVANPVDMLASASADHYRRAASLLLADDSVDSLVAIFVPPFVTPPRDVAEALASIANSRSDKPFLAVFVSPDAPRDALSGVPCYTFPEAAVAALGHATRYATWRRQAEGTRVAFPDMDVPALKAMTQSVLARGGGWLTPAEAQRLMSASGIPVALLSVATTPEEVVASARTLGFPVVLKASGPTILHKSDVGGVRLGLGSDVAVLAAAQDMQARLGAALTGFLVQATAPAGVEMLVGAVDDPAFGHVISCGAGGVLVELTSDISFRLHPLTDVDARELVDERRCVALLRGFRGARPADEPALREVLLRVSALLDICPEIQELDINPLRVLPHGAAAVDVRVRIDRAAPGAAFRRVRY